MSSVKATKKLPPRPEKKPLTSKLCVLCQGRSTIHNAGYTVLSGEHQVVCHGKIPKLLPRKGQEIGGYICPEHRMC